MDEKRPRGWHAAGGKPPRKGKGTATVEPIRDRKDIGAVRNHLSKNQRDRTLFVCGINFGLRGGDLLGLKWKDVLNPKGKIKDVIEVIEQKTDKLRRIPLVPKVRRELDELLHTHKDPNDPDAKPEGDPEDYVFPSRKGRDRMSIQRLHQLVNEWCKAVGLKGRYGSHTLRKTFGYHAYKQGASLSLLMDVFNHSSERMTLRYIGIRQDEKDDVHFRLDL
jgi:integrase